MRAARVDTAGVPVRSMNGRVGARRRTVERLLAVGYGLTYESIVRGFAPYEALLDEVAALVSGIAARAGRRLRVLDVSCGVGTVAARLARDGHVVVGIDAVHYLIDVARGKMRGIGGRNLAFHPVDIARGPVPGGAYDVVLSMHTLYWHPDPTAFLAACRRVLGPGGDAIFLTYARPARVWSTFAEVRSARGAADAVRALRWLVPTAVFERFRDCDHRYLDAEEFRTMLTGAGFEVLETRHTFLADLSLLAWTRTHRTAGTVAAMSS